MKKTLICWTIMLVAMLTLITGCDTIGTLGNIEVYDSGSARTISSPSPSEEAESDAPSDMPSPQQSEAAESNPPSDEPPPQQEKQESPLPSDDVPATETHSYREYMQNGYYEYVDDDTSTYIHIDYLHIAGHPDKEIERSLNQMLSDMAGITDPPMTEEGLSLDVQYSYEILAERYLSVGYSVLYDQIAAAHPWRSLDCLTVDLQTGQVIELADVMALDERLMQKLVNREFDQSIDGGSAIVGLEEGALDIYSGEGFYYEICRNGIFYLNSTSIGFVVGVSHADGDYWVLSFPYDSVKELLNPWFIELIP